MIIWIVTDDSRNPRGNCHVKSLVDCSGSPFEALAKEVLRFSVRLTSSEEKPHHKIDNLELMRRVGH
jgi:hypothetical protein